MRPLRGDLGLGCGQRDHRASARDRPELVDSLDPGETGCLREGTYHGNAFFRIGGSHDQRMTLQSYPGERAKIAGQVRVLESAAFVTIRMLDLDGSTAPRCGAATTCSVQASPWIQGDDTVVSDNDITNQNAGICLLVGTSGRSPAERTAFEHNRVHHCGRRPSGNLDHGFYLEHAVDTRVERNLIHDNVDRGVQLYPSSTRTVIRNNVLDGNGENVRFGGSSSDNRVEGNVITNARIRHNVESFASTGTRNTVHRNCVWGAARAGAPAPAGIQSPQVGFTAHDNLVVDPRYVDRADEDFRLRDDSPCRAVLGDVAPGPREEGTDDGPGLEPPVDSEPCEAGTQALEGLTPVEAFDDGSTGAPETSEDADAEERTDGHEDDREDETSPQEPADPSDEADGAEEEESATDRGDDAPETEQSEADGGSDEEDGEASDNTNEDDAGDEDVDDSGAEQDAGSGDSEDGDRLGDEESVQDPRAQDVDAPADASGPAVSSLDDSCDEITEETVGGVGGPGETAGGTDGGSPGSGGISGSGIADPSGGSDGGSSEGGSGGGSGGGGSGGGGSGGGGGGGGGASETSVAASPIPHISSPPATSTTLSGDPVKRRFGRCVRFRQRTAATRALKRRARRSCKRSARQATARGRASAARR